MSAHDSTSVLAETAIGSAEPSAACRLPGVTPHDPNARWGRKVFRLTFRVWAYEAQFEASVGGNCLGMSNLETAIHQVLEQLEEPAWGYRMRLTDPKTGDELDTDSEDEDPEDWLAEMMVCAELIAVVEEKATQP